MIEADERTAADGDLRAAVHIRIIDAVDKVSVLALAVSHLLEQGEITAINGQGALLNLDNTNVADKRTILDGQVAVHHVDGIAVVLLGRDGAVTGDGHLGATLDGQDGVGIIAPDSPPCS